MATPIVALYGCKPTREGKALTERAITDTHLAGLTGLSRDRIKVLESLNPSKVEEPWLDEAYLISSALCADLATLIGSTMLHDVDTGFDIQDDLAVWRCGVRLPLRFGIRLGRLFHIDPFELLRITPMVKQIWSVVASGERTGGQCPWCIQTIVGDAGHLPGCVPAALWGPRDQPVIPTIGTAPKPRRPGVRRQGSKHAPGLRALRDRIGVTQEQFATGIGKHPAYYSRLEQLRDPLGIELAEKIAALYKISLYEVYYGKPEPLT